MNIVYLHSHDTGRYIQPYGYAVDTPNLQRLAEEGTLFRDAHAVAPTCSPSRAGLLTGQTAHGAGMVGLAHRGGKLLKPERHLANFLHAQGFETVLAGLSHLGPEGADCYQERREGSVREGKETARYAADYIRNHNGAKPFFLDVGYTETHRTEWVSHGFNQERHEPKDGDGNAGFVTPPPVFPDTPDTRRDWLDYRHSVERLDRYHGQVIDALREQGILEDTLVIATTDHGLAFPDMKCKLTHHGTGVLQVIRFPQGIGREKVVDAMVSHLDLFPTICDLLGVDRPEWLEGKSLLPLVKGETSELHNYLCAEVTFHAAFEPKRSVRSKRWNYIRNFAAPHTEVMPNCDAGYSKTLWMEHGMADRQVPNEELYDLVFDPQERRNLANDPGYSETIAIMRQHLGDWMKRTEDPLLSKDPSVMPLPQKVNPWDEPHPGAGAVEWNPDEWKMTQ